MRRARFAGVSGHSREGVRPLSLAQLLLFDFRASIDEDEEAVAAERARSLIVSLPYLAAAHLFWSAVLLFALARSGAGGEIAAVATLCGAALALDAGLWAFARRRAARPHRIAALAALHAAASAGLWIAAAALAMTGPAAESVLAKAALVAGIGSGISALFMIPALVLLSCAGTLAAAALLRSDQPLVAIGFALAASLVGLSVLRARDSIFGAQRRMAAERQANKASRFVADFEESGRGWFWETNGEGALTYVSQSLATHLGSEAKELIGRPLSELVLVDEEKADSARNALGFHLSARFPFADVIVRAPGREDIWWSLSGQPNFDRYGRFLGFRGLGTNLSEERRTEAETTKLARYDSLTGLPNRALMERMLDEAVDNAAERRRGCALMMIDLDRFKPVNDSFGHPVGDKLLRKVAGRLSAVLDGEGQVGRLGGDEFQAILPGIEEHGRLEALAGRIIEELCKPYSIEGHRIVIGASVGIAVATPGRAYASALVKEADLALYAAKAAGRGTHRFFAAEMHSEAAERQILENDLREALTRAELRLLYQPIVEAVSEEIVAFEALLRWHHPTRGILPPDLFVPIGEEIGLMPRIGEWVLRTACAEAVKWPPHVRVAVNLSPSQCADSGLTAAVTGALAASQLDPDRLELEITEGVFLADGGASERVLAALKGLGVRLVLDNFGTGQSGLAHLRSAPLNKIKIDRSFVCGAADRGSRNGAIVRAIVVLAESLGMDTTAEGAETLEELSLIRSLGCSQVQGFIFGKPVSAAEALAAAADSRPPAEVIGFSRPPRHRILRSGTLWCDGESLPVRLRNISTGGAMIECERSLAPETRVKLDLEEGGIVDAEVRWCQRGQAGLQFARAYELKKLARPKKGVTGLKMLTPAYLEPQPEAPPSVASPLARKPARR